MAGEVSANIFTGETQEQLAPTRHRLNSDFSSVVIVPLDTSAFGNYSVVDIAIPTTDEEKIVWEIVEQVEKMQSPQELHVADHPVVMGSRAEELISTLRLDRDDVLVVGVFRISGIGKTTIVKAMYNKIASKFQLNKDGKVAFCQSFDGVTKIQHLLRCKKTLLVVDDVDHFERLEVLGIVNPQSFYKGSRIIVTTRDVDSLGGIPHTSYHTRLLNERESRKLFIPLMFAIDEPVHANFVKEAVACAGGLPLVLKQLQMSYDSLSPDEKNLFMDIACFFNGLRNNLVLIKVLNEEDFSVDYEIEKLAHKFLVENNGHEVSLSHVIKEMGHEVVRQENPEEPGQRTRLMGHRDVVRVLRENSGTHSVRSIRLDCNHIDKMEEEATVELEAFKKMSNLKFIMLNDDNLKWSYSSNDNMSACFSFKQLKYLHWRYFPCKSLDNIDMGNVVVIILQNSKLKKLWKGANKSLKKLKILDVSDSSSLIKTGSFIGLENIEELNLSGCENLIELDSSVGCLKKLVYLTLFGCKRLQRLPWEMIGKLTSLQQLNFGYCTNISNEVGGLKSVRYLLSSKNKFSSHPNSLCQLHQLTTITLYHCTKLKSIPNLPPNIEYLYAQGCKNLVNLPLNISELQNLEHLILNDCLKLGSEGFTQVTGLRNLERLNMRNCNVSQVSSGIGNLVSLRELYLSGNTFSSLPESFSNLSNLERLEINDSSELQLLPPLPSHLKNIKARDCRSLDVMPFDSMQNAYIFPSKVFKFNMLEPRLMSDEGLHIYLSGEEVPEWCTYGNNSGNVLSFVAPIQFHHTKICGLILCATRGNKDVCEKWVCPAIYNQTKGTSHRLRDVGDDCGTMMVMFYPLNDTTLVVEAGDTVEVEFLYKRVLSCGLRLVYEDDVVDSGLVIKDAAKPTLSC
ncbi:TMV resistance protein N [Tanacetum coccineum]